MGVSIQSDQVQIPVVKTSDDALNQTQQNINKVLRNMNNKTVEGQGILAKLTIIGEVKFANLSLAQFQSIAGGDWVLANGQSVIDSAYSKLTGNNLAPNVSVSGVTAFVRIN